MLHEARLISRREGRVVRDKLSVWREARSRSDGVLLLPGAGKRERAVVVQACLVRAFAHAFIARVGTGTLEEGL